MRKLLQGIIDFRGKITREQKETFSRLALGQSPDALFLACSDSRVVPNLFASTNPGDLFVIRNVGNLVSPCAEREIAKGDKSEAAAIEFAISELKVSDIIICGHSECGAMIAALSGKKLPDLPNLEIWLENAKPALAKYKAGSRIDPSQAPHNQLSQLNVLQQLENLKTYSVVRKRVESGQLRLHGWWFDIAHADVYAFDPDLRRLDVIDEQHAQRIMDRISRK